MVSKKTKAQKIDTGTISFALKNFWVDYAGWGRARRSEYWWVFLFYCFALPFAFSFVLLFIGGFLAALTGSEIFFVLFEYLADVIGWAWTFATLVPSFCLGVRRLHDTNRSAWNYLWILLPIIGAIILIVLMCIQGDSKSNRFGAPRM